MECAQATLTHAGSRARLRPFLVEICRRESGAQEILVRSVMLRLSRGLGNNAAVAAHVQSTLAEEVFLRGSFHDSAHPLCIANFAPVTLRLMLMLCAGCGSSSPGSQNLASAPAQTVSQSVEVALQSALTTAWSGLLADQQRSLAAVVGHLTPNPSFDCTSEANGGNLQHFSMGIRASRSRRQ
jgi:hypothetical protein